MDTLRRRALDTLHETRIRLAAHPASLRPAKTHGLVLVRRSHRRGTLEPVGRGREAAAPTRTTKTGDICGSARGTASCPPSPPFMWLPSLRTVCLFVCVCPIVLCIQTRASRVIPSGSHRNYHPSGKGAWLGCAFCTVAVTLCLVCSSHERCSN